jgi:hypothetical protein
MKPESNHQTLPYADVDFDGEGRVTKNIAAKAAADPTLQHIVRRLLRGETLTLEERRYYVRAAPAFITPDR